MSEVTVKMCGFMHEEDIDIAIERGVDIVGMVVEYPVPVPWNMSLSRAAELVKYFRKKVLELKGKTRCCVVTGGDIHKVSDIVHTLEPDYIQLHYKDTAEDIRSLRALDQNISIIKTVPLKEEDRVSQSGTADLGQCAAVFEKAGADIVLVDARGPENAAASVSMIDSEIYFAVKKAVKIPVMVAGGITPDNVRYIVSELKPDIIDMMTGIEKSPGVKSEEKIRSIMEGVRYE